MAWNTKDIRAIDPANAHLEGRHTAITSGIPAVAVTPPAAAAPPARGRP